MGCVSNVGHEKFPKQGTYAGKRVRVMFDYREPIYGGVMVRDDSEEPFRGIIRLDDGRHILTTECQWRPE